LDNNYYGKLGISFSTNIDQIKSVYVKLAKEHHPVSCYDQHSKPKQAKTMAHLNKTYEILVDPIKKDEYDFMSSSSPSPSSLPLQPPKSSHSKSHSLPIQKHPKIIIMMLLLLYLFQ
jgi:DnaJ-class molecular chaperone